MNNMPETDYEREIKLNSPELPLESDRQQQETIKRKDYSFNLAWEIEGISGETRGKIDLRHRHASTCC
jgi:hypothetical protein